MHFYVKKLGSKEKTQLKSSLFYSKHLHYNLYNYPRLKQIKLAFPFLISNKRNNKNILITILNFLEQITNQKSIIKRAQIIGNENTWVRCQVDLSGFVLYRFLLFFSEFIEMHPLLIYSYKKPHLKKVNYNFFKLYLFDVDLFFPGQMRRNLPQANHYWFEMDFKFTLNSKLPFFNNLNLYTQLFFDHSLIH